MQLSTRFSIAVHTLLCICVAARSKRYKATSEFIALSVGVNPVTIRKCLGALKRAGLAEVAAGTGGATLAREPERISLLDIFRAVGMVEEETLFSFHEKPNQACPVGRSITPLLGDCMRHAQQAMEKELAAVSLADLFARLEQ